MNHFSGKIPIAMPTFNRLDYLKEVLDALKNCDGLENFFIVTSEEPDMGSGVHEFFESIDWIEVKRNVNPSLLKCDYNVPTAVSRALSYSDKVIVLEDDVKPSKDMLVYFKTLLEDFKNDPEILSITAFHRNMEKPSEDMLKNIQTYPHFSVWGWATWKKNWEEFIKDYQPKRTGWDGELNLFRQKKGFREIQPLVSRCNNIGTKGNRVQNYAWQKVHQSTLFTSDDLSYKYSGKYQLIEKHEKVEDLIVLEDELYKGGELIHSKEFDFKLFKYFCKGTGAKISAPSSGVSENKKNPYNTRISSPFISFQEKEYGPFIQKKGLMEFLSENPPQTFLLHFIFVEKILEHALFPLKLIQQLLEHLYPDGFLYLEINHMYRAFSELKQMNLADREQPKEISTIENLFYLQQQINFWSPENFIKMLKPIESLFRIEGTSITNEHRKNKFCIIIQKI